MDEKELSYKELKDFIESDEPISDAKKISLDDFDFFSKPDFTPIEKILEQRQNHRGWIIILASMMAMIPLILIFGIITVQVTYRMYYDTSFTILEGHELEVLSVSIFGEAVGILAIITKSLWDDTPYKDFFSENNGNTKNNCQN